ncbi:hypothetical protein DFJ63DRAFT_338527 [Scheffersomyces coipomensis]|uniref:uncharacterized protein n=1 Tax=Scheffersomyces coipomensis TaxID=1788519 RepID=UPI00315CC9B7
MGASSNDFPAHLISLRASLNNTSITNYNESVRFAISIEQYLEEILQFARTESGKDDLMGVKMFAAKLPIASGSIPWSHVHIGPVKDKIQDLKKKLTIKRPGSNDTTESIHNIRWTLLNEIELVLISIAFIYIKVGSELTNEIIDEEYSNQQESNEKWKQVVNLFKTSISYSLFGISLKSHNATLYTFVNKVAEVCIQMSILSKSSWINRGQFNENEAFQTTNNGTLARVAVYVNNEIRSLKNMIVELQASNNIQLDSSHWIEYLNIIEKYSQAYTGLFLSIENYQQDKLGHAIGLVHFSLLSLQSKRVDESTNKLKNKILNKRNDNLLNKLNSLSTLDINKSIFNSSQITLNDMSYLFDQLIKLNLKFEKENNNLNIKH